MFRFVGFGNFTNDSKATETRRLRENTLRRVHSVPLRFCGESSLLQERIFHGIHQRLQECGDGVFAQARRVIESKLVIRFFNGLRFAAFGNSTPAGGLTIEFQIAQIAGNVRQMPPLA